MASQTLCERFGFDPETIAERLQLIGLGEPHSELLARDLQNHVIRSNIDAIIDSFYDTLGCHREFIGIVQRHTEVSKLKMMQRCYLLSLGENFESAEYFEERLRIGVVHQRVGVSLSLYHSAYRLMQSLLIDNIPDELRSNPTTFLSLVQFITKIAALDMSLAIETYYFDRISSLERSIDSMKQSIDTMRGEGEELRRSLRTDSLTKLCSRGFSIHALKEALTISRDAHRPLSVVMVDLDHFKDINDKYGHPFGDRILATVAARLSFDARDRDTIGRYGGEEFILILEDTPIADARILAERIRLKVSSDPIQVADQAVSITISLGVASISDDDDAESLTGRADKALYAAKAAGRDCVEIAETG
jgi:diguanylate cyclase (GGDEF)-like protein